MIEKKKTFQINLPGGFYKLPNPANISKVPVHPYKYGNTGNIHSSKIEQLLEISMNNSPYVDKIKMIQGLFEGLAVADDLAHLEMDELADYLRHFAYLNRNQLTWDVSDEILQVLEKSYFPRWDLPGSKIDKNFRVTFSKIVDWDITEEENEAILEFFQQIKNEIPELGNSPILINLESSINRQFLNIKQLAALYESLIFSCYELSICDRIQMNPLIDKIESLFNDLLRMERSSGLSVVGLIYIGGLMRKDIDDVIKAKQLLEFMYDEIIYDDNKNNDEYRWIFGSFFSKITSRLFEYENDIVARRMIIADILTNHIKPTEIDFPQWESHLLKTKPHPIVFSYIIQGYGEMLYTLKEHAFDTLDKEEAISLLNTHKNLAIFLVNLIMKYISTYGRVNSVENIFDPSHLSNIQDLQLPPIQEESLRISLYFAIKYYLLTSKPNEKEKNDLLRLCMTLLEGFYVNEYTSFLELDMNLNFEKTLFDEFLKKIEEEFGETHTLLTCFTFEMELVRPFSDLFNYLQNNSGKIGFLERYFLEILIWYLSEWYWKLSDKGQMGDEANMIIAPFLSILFSKMAIYFYNHNQNTKAHIMMINDYFFKINANFLSPFEENQSVENALGELIEQMSYIYEEMNLKLSPMLSDLKNLSTLNLSTSKKSFVNLKSMVGYDANISGDLTFQYMDKRDFLNDFFAKVRECNSTDEIKELIKTKSPYLPPNRDSINNFEKIGLLSAKEVVDKYRFPIIREINSYSLAISMFPMAINLPKFNIDMEF